MGAKFHYKRPHLTDYQIRLLDSKARFTVCEAATKVGKTASHIIWLFEQALDLKDGQECWWVAPTYSQAEIAFRRMKKQVTIKDFFISNETKLLLTLPTGARIGFKTAEKPDNLYGDDVYAAVFDEFTRAKELAWFALRSTLTSTNGKCKLIGNAKGRKNWGYLLGQRAKNGEQGYEYHKITIYDALREQVPGITIAEIEQAQRDLPEYVFNELYLAEASESGSNPFGIENIRRAIRPLSSNQVVAYGVDLAKYKDWTVIVGLDNDGQVAYFNRFQKDWAQTMATLIQVIGKTPAYIDATGVGDPIVEQVARKCPRTKGFKYTAISKQQLMESLASAIQQQSTFIIEGVMQDEMESFEFEYENARVTFNAPNGSHDDCVNALALAYDCKLHNPKGTFAYA